MANISYNNKNTGDRFSASEVNQIKSVVNTNYNELQGIDSRLTSAESSITSLEGVTIPDIESNITVLTDGLSELQLRRADWDTATITVLDNADKWIESHTQTHTYSADWNESYTRVSTTSAGWEEAYNSVSTTSAKWDLAYNTVISLSTDWAIDIDTQLDITTTDLYTTVRSNSASWSPVDDGELDLTEVDNLYVKGPKWTPLEDTTNIVSWHDASDESTIAVDGDNNLTGWVDKLTQQDGMFVDINNDASDGGGDVLSLTSTINGLNVVNINENSFLRYGSYTNIGNTSSIFLVCRVDIVNENSDSVLAFKSPGGVMSWQLGSGNQNKFSGLFASSNLGAESGLTMGDDLRSSVNLFHIKFDWSGQKLYGYLNGEEVFSTTYTQHDSIGNDLLYLFINRGEQAGITGAVAELITTTDISDENTTKIESYLCDKWDIQIAGGHPYEIPSRTIDSEITFTEDVSWPQGGSVDTNDVNTVVKANSGSWGSAGGFTNWSEDTSGNIIPAANATYDIGSAEKKVRHFYLSDTTMYFGESEVSFNSGNVLRSVEFSESVEVPAPGSPGRKGDIRYITPYMYVCIETDTWVRQTVETGW